ncbi:hypothetical protein AAC387_Pa04g2146 [Persea americana]
MKVDDKHKVVQYQTKFLHQLQLSREAEAWKRHEDAVVQSQGHDAKKGHNNSNRNKRKEGQEALEKKRGLWVKPRRGRSTPTYVVKAWFASSSSWFCFVLLVCGMGLKL